MSYQLTYCVHKSKCKNAETLVFRSNGKIPDTQPDWKSTAPDFIPRIAKFKNLNDVNSFVYYCYNAYGLFFFIEGLIRT